MDMRMCTLQHIPVRRGMSDLPWGISIILLIRPMLIRPSKHLVIAPTHVRCSNAVNANLREWLKGHIAGAHNGLPDVVDAVVAVVDDLVGRIVLDGLRLVGVPDEVETVQLVEHADAIHLARLWAVGRGQAGRQIVGEFVWDFDDAVTWGHQALPGIVGAVADSAIEAVWLEDHGGVKDDYQLVR